MQITLNSRRWHALRWLTLYLRTERQWEALSESQVFWVIGTMVPPETVQTLGARGALDASPGGGRPRVSQGGEAIENARVFEVSPMLRAGLRALAVVLEVRSPQEAVAQLADAVLQEAPDVARGERAVWEAIAPGLGAVVELVRQRCGDVASPGEGAANA